MAIYIRKYTAKLIIGVSDPEEPELCLGNMVNLVLVSEFLLSAHALKS